MPRDREIVVVDGLEYRPRRPAVHLLPALSALGSAGLGFRFEVSALTAGGWSPWVAGAPVGPGAFPAAPSRHDGLVAEVDEFRLTAPATAVRLRLRAQAADPAALGRAPWLISLSCWDGECPPVPSGGGAPRIAIPVPARSQMVEDPAIRLRICSPTSVAMVLEHWGRPVATAALAAEVFHPGLDRYGVWPAAVGAAARHGVAGYLLRFPDWDSAAWCLARGLPLVVSLRYGRSELTGAAIEETDGHLVVLTGLEADDVLVNDPAAPSAAAVPRRYRRAEVARAWLGGSGVGYVLFPGPAAGFPRP